MVFKPKDFGSKQILTLLAKSHIVVVELWLKFLLQLLKPMQGSILSSYLKIQAGSAMQEVLQQHIPILDF